MGIKMMLLGIAVSSGWDCHYVIIVILFAIFVGGAARSFNHNCRYACTGSKNRQPYDNNSRRFDK